MYIEDTSGNQTESASIGFRTRATPDTSAPRVRSIQVDPKSRASFTIITSEPARIKIFLMLVGAQPVVKRLEDDEYIIVDSDDFRRITQLSKGGFIEGSTYQFFVRAADQSGNVGVSRPRTFTVRAPDTTPPVILYSLILQNGGDYAVLGIGTDELTIARVDYAPADDPTDISTVFSTVVTNNHIVIITNLLVDTSYQFAFTVTDQSNNSSSSNPTVPPQQVAKLVENKTLFKVLQGPGQSGRFTTNQSPDTQAPVILNGPTIVSQSADALTIQWETDELSSSIVEYGVGNFNETEALSDNVTTHTVTLSSLSSSTTYQYRISSQDPNGNGPTLGPAPLNVAAATTTIEPDISPPQISNVTVSSVTNDKAIITFTTDEPGDGFVDFDTTTTDFSRSLGSTTLGTDHSVTLTNLGPGKTYYYRARSTDANGNGPGFGSTETFTTALSADTADPVVSNLSVRSGFRYAEITWDTDEVSNSFIQVVDAAADTLSVATLTLTTTHSITVADTTFLPGSANQYTVIAGSTDPSGNSGENNTQFTTLSEADTTAPAVPAGLTATAGNGAVSLTWDANSEPDFGGYLIFRILSGDTTQVATGVTDASYLDESVSNDSSYSYYLKSVDNAIPTPNLSEASGSVDVTPASGAEPTAPSTVSPVSNTEVSLKPILLLDNATPGTSGGTLSYTFAVYSDSALTQLVASISGIPEGTTSNPTHWQVPATVIRIPTLNRVNFHDFDVVILPSAAVSYSDVLDDGTIRRLEDWVTTGGTLITLGEASRWASMEDVGLIDRPIDLPLGQVEGYADAVSRSLLQLQLNQRHWLSAGTDGTMQMLSSARRVFLPAPDAGSTVVGIYGDASSLVVGGRLPEEIQSKLASQPVIVHQTHGSGQVIAFLEEPNGFGYAEGTGLLFINAVLLGPGHLR